MSTSCAGRQMSNRKSFLCVVSDSKFGLLQMYFYILALEMLLCFLAKVR